eukprot:CAMPEP_0202053486 /NCGR_PEP_ID=MMETSP0963-20130614/5883_1 /ASSEMBLY_ACC=CAM_ASM_000494 /TAXON_ID=4773 /ORGANISM="Schizochytrium aggregatum, Strain ATCC28209" /LENGTH=140 /DNA_ID=CAMNT_0048618827 /DNA_START=742 /DNA_END=1161 /DNA_ORIENTATION=-
MTGRNTTNSARDAEESPVYMLNTKMARLGNQSSTSWRGTSAAELGCGYRLVKQEALWPVLCESGRCLCAQGAWVVHRSDVFPSRQPAGRQGRAAQSARQRQYLSCREARCATLVPLLRGGSCAPTTLDDSLVLHQPIAAT